MSEEQFLYCKADGTWAFYDDTYDITIHCESKEEQDKAVELLRNVQQKEAMLPEDAARILKRFCSKHPDRCDGCPFESINNGKYGCKLKKQADEWDV